jgi:hypothetical protein
MIRWDLVFVEPGSGIALCRILFQNCLPYFPIKHSFVRATSSRYCFSTVDPVLSSDPDPWHFGVDPDPDPHPRILASD